MLQILQLGNEKVFGSSNPGVFTDARCFMNWIASQYNMKMPPEYTEPSSCSDTNGRGDKSDINKEVCNAQLLSARKERTWKPCAKKLQPDPPTNCGVKGCELNCTQVSSFHEDCINKVIKGCFETTSVKVLNTMCDFKKPDPSDNMKPWSECRLSGTEGFSQNVFQCLDTRGETAICSNNCKGMNPNGIIIGGTAVAIAATVSATGFLTPAVMGAVGLGAVGAGAVGVGGASAFFTDRCPNTRPCRVRQ